MSHIPKLKQYSKRDIGEIHDYATRSGMVRFSPLPNFLERSVSHEAVTYCRYWFGQDFSITKVNLEHVLDTIRYAPHRTFVVVVLTHRKEFTLRSRAKVDEILSSLSEPPTAEFEITSPHAHNQYIELVIFRGAPAPHPTVRASEVEPPAQHSEPDARDPEYEMSPDELANDMPSILPEPMIDFDEHFFGRSVPTRWTPFLSQAEAPGYYKYVWGWR